jgi:hypothetical protein
MADRIDSFKVICSGGLNSNENHLDLSDNKPGAATRLVNYEPSLFGGYRRVEGFELYDAAYPEVDDVNNAGSAEGKVLGLAIFKDDVSNLTKIIAARKDVGATTYSFYYYTPLIGWRPFTLDHSIVRNTTDGVRTVEKLRHVSFNFGTGNRICFVDGVNPAIVYDGQHWEELRSTGTGGNPADAGHTTNTGGGDQCLDAPALVDVFANHLFLAGDETNRATIAHSAPTNSASPYGYYDFTNANAAGQLAAGFDVVQIKPFRDNLFVFGSNGIKKVAADVTSGFVTDQVTANVGCISRDSVLEIGGDLMFLAPDGFRPVAGTARIGDVELETVSKSIQGLLVNTIQNFDMDTINGVVIRSKSQIRYFVGDDTIDTPDSLGIIGGLSDSTGSISWEFGELLGIRASCATSDYIGTEEFVLHGDYDGKVYRQERNTTFNGADIVAVYATPYLDFGETEERKVLRKINTFIRAEGPLEMNLSVAFDWGDYNTARPSTYSQASEGGPTVFGGRNITYNGANVVYGGSSKPIMTSDIQGSGFSIKATYVTVGDFEPYSIQGIVFEYSTAGRR